MVNEHAAKLFGTEDYAFTPGDDGGRSVFGGTKSNGIAVFSYGFAEGINYAAEKLNNYTYTVTTMPALPIGSRRHKANTYYRLEQTSSFWWCVGGGVTAKLGK